MNPITKVAYAYINHKYPTPADAWPRRIPTPEASAPVSPGQNRADSAGGSRHSDRGPRHVTGRERAL